MHIEPRSVSAVIMAGGVNRIPLYDGYRPGYKAVLDINGTPSIRYPLRALRESRYVRDICIVGAHEDLVDAVGDPGVAFTPPGESLLESIVGGLSFFRDRALVLATTADLALLSSMIVDTFINACAEAPTAFETNLFLSVVRKEEFTGPFGRVDKIMARFRDGTFCHGNLAIVQPAILDDAAAMDRINAVYAGRKGALSSALAFGARVGLAFVVGVYLLHLLTIRQMAAIASARFQMGIVPVPIPFPEVALDVDEPADYRLVSEILSRRSAP